MSRIEKEVKSYAIIDGDEFFKVNIGPYCHKYIEGNKEDREKLSQRLLVSKKGVFKRICENGREDVQALNGDVFKINDVNGKDDQLHVAGPWGRVMKSRLMACTFLELLKKDWVEVDHEDGRGGDHPHRLSNLKYLTPKDHGKKSAEDAKEKSASNQKGINKDVAMAFSEMLQLLINDDNPIIKRHYSSPTEKLSHIKVLYMEKRQSFDAFVKINK